MSSVVPTHPFARSGLGALSDLELPEYKQLFSRLEREQERFLAAENRFRSPGYKWPRDPLHCWSRIWEYPYVFHHLANDIRSYPPGRCARVVDLGSAVTFFPFSIAQLGCHVDCLDIDPSCGPDIEKAASLVDHQLGSIDFGLISNDRFPLQDGETDALYCVSVLEHIPDSEKTVNEIVRVLRPGGLLILTIDVDLCGYVDIGVSKYRRLREALAKHFEFVEPEITIHPLDMLRATNSPRPYLTYSLWKKCKFHAKVRMRPLFGKRPMPPVLPDLAVWAGVLRKRPHP